MHWPFDKRIEQIFCLFGCFYFFSCVSWYYVWGRARRGIITWKYIISFHRHRRDSGGAGLAGGGGPGGGTRIIFWRGERPEVWNPYPYLRIFRFSRNFCKSGPISKEFFLPQKWLIFAFFCNFCEMGPSSNVLRIFAKKRNPVGRHIPVGLNMWVPPGGAGHSSQKYTGTYTTPPPLSGSSASPETHLFTPSVS